MIHFSELYRSMNTLVLRSIMVLIFLLGILASPVSGQQIKLNSGAYLNSTGANIVVNGKVDNTGSIANSGTVGFNISGDLLNTGTFVTGSATHKIGGNFSNIGTFTGTGGTITFNGTPVQSISSTSDIIFNNLTIDNITGVTLISNSLTTVSGTLVINSGKKFEIAPGKQLTVSGTITNNAGISGFVIHSDATGDGKLINNTPAVSGTVELYLAGGAGTSGPAFHYFVPPVQSMSIGSTIAAVKTSLGLTNFNGDLMSYSETAAGSNKDHGWQYFDGYNSTTPFSSLTSSNGYNIYLTSADKITFSGSLNAASQTFSSLSYTNLGWNLIGNPYPCNYDLDGIVAIPNASNIDKTIYYNNKGGYAYWNIETGAGTTGYSVILPPLQGFFVHVTAADKSLSFPVTSKTVTIASPLRSKGENLVKKLKLVLNNGVVPDETIVCLIDKATSGFDGDYDAYKLFGGGTETPFIYTELNSVKYAINSIMDPGSSVAIIPVTVVIKTPGLYKIDITEFENLEGINIVLRHGAIETILSKNAGYSFTSDAGTFTDFQLIIGNIVTGVENLAKQNLKTWYSNDYLYINCPYEISSNKGSLIIYDIQGKMVYTNNMIFITQGQTIQLPLILPKGIYVTHIISNSQPFVTKIVVL